MQRGRRERKEKIDAFFHPCSTVTLELAPRLFWRAPFAPALLPRTKGEKAVDRLPLHDGFARLPLSILITTFDSLAVSMRSTDLGASVVGSLSPGNNAVVLCWWSRAYYGSISLGSNDLSHTFTEGLIQIFRRESPTISVHMGVSQGIVHTYSFGSPSSARLSGTSSSLHSLEHRL